MKGMKFQDTMKMVQNKKQSINNAKKALTVGVIAGIITPRLGLTKSGMRVVNVLITGCSYIALKELIKATKK